MSQLCFDLRLESVISAFAAGLDVFDLRFRCRRERLCRLRCFRRTLFLRCLGLHRRFVGRLLEQMLVLKERQNNDKRADTDENVRKVEDRKADKPEIEEVVLSDAEWEANFGGRQGAAGEAGLTAAQIQEAAQVFSRIRD